MRPNRRWRVLSLGALSGALYFLSLPPYSLRPLAWIALAPLCLAVWRSTSWKRAALAGAAAAMVAAFGGYFWIADMAHRFWQVPWVFAVFLLFLYGTFAEIHFTVFALLWWLVRRAKRGRQGRTLRLSPPPGSDRGGRLGEPAVLVAALFVACELFVPRVFPDKLGHSQLGMGPLPHAAALVGTHGISFALAWLAAGLATLVAGPRGRPRRQAGLEVVLGVLLLAGLSVAGARASQAQARVPAARSFEVLLVQSIWGDPEELAGALGSVTAAVDSTMNIYEGLTRRALTTAAAAGASVDLVVCRKPPCPRCRARASSPACKTSPPLRRADRRCPALRLATRPRQPLAHLQRRVPQGLPSGEVSDEYYKHKLLLFGEYVPLSDRFPRLLNLLPSPGEFTSGPGPKVFRAGGVALSPLICYELLFPRLVRGSLRAGGEVIVNLTNDYWFGRHLEPHQHLELARMSAIEVGRPVLRATNTGISAVIDGRGEILASTGVWVQDVLRVSVPVPPMELDPLRALGRMGDGGAGRWRLCSRDAGRGTGAAPGTTRRRRR